MEMNAIYYTASVENSYIDAILKEIYRDRIYAPILNGKRNLDIIDIGANIGLTSAFFSKYAHKVWSFEPAKRHLKCLKKMVKFNKLTNIKVMPYAIGGKKGQAEFYHNDNVTMFSLLPTQQGAEKEIVKVIDIYAAIRKTKMSSIDLVKLDVEGAEFEVLGSLGFRKAAPMIKNILIEYHTWSGRNPGQLVQILESAGFTVSQIPTDASIFWGKRM